MKNKLIENIFSMVSLRGLEYILSFILVPYLLRVLGPENFGAIAFMQGIIAYINIVIDYGFNLTAPRAIVMSSKENLSGVFSAYFWGKLFLWLGVSLVAVFVFVILQSVFEINFNLSLFIVVYFSVIGNVLFPIWFFQGIQEMRYITILNLMGRLLSIVCIFLFVHEAGDYILAAFFQSIVTVIAGLGSLYMIYTRFPGVLKHPNKNNIIFVYKEGWRIFVSMLAVNLYTTSNLVILGLFTNNTIVGYYSGADKLINCIRRGIDAINTAVYPYITNLMQYDMRKSLSFLYKQIKIYAICGICCGVILLFGAPWIIHQLLGMQYSETIVLFQIMSFIPLAVSISNILGGEILLPLKKEKAYSNILCFGAAFNLSIIIPLTYLYGAQGTAITYLCTESLITLSMGFIVYKKNYLRMRR